MSWEAVILKISGPFRPIEDVADEDYLPLGSAESVAERIRAAFPAAEWSSPTWATWELDDVTGVTIDLEAVESDHSLIVSVSGSGNPVPHLLALARANDWAVLDCSTSELINPDVGSSEGWEGYQSLMGRMHEPTPAVGDQAPPQVAPQVATQSAPQIAPEAAPPAPPRPRPRKKKKAAKKVKRKVKRQAAAKKAKPKKTRSSKKKSPKKKSSGKKNAGKKRPKKKK